MNRNDLIPLVVGVSAHRALRAEDRAALSSAVKEQLEALRRRCPSTPLVMLSSLAEGGDLLCADAAEELGIALIAVLPMEREEFEKDFSEEALARFSHHCARAEKVFAAPPTETPGELPSRDFLYRQAGIYVSEHSHVLLALWDGEESDETRCGTAAAVDFSLRGAYSPAGGVSLRSDANEIVIHIFTPRGKSRAEKAGTVRLLGDRAAFDETLEKTEEFNCLALAAASTLIAVAFLLYDEAEALWMILICGGMLLAAALCRRAARRTACHRRYIDYRALAECLRVQCFLRYAGSGVGAAELMTWTQQEETGWIMEALCALTIGTEREEGHDIRACWVEAQEDYHRRAGEKASRRTRGSERTVRAALTVSIALYLAALLFELLCGGALLRPLFTVGDASSYRTLPKLVLGSISAATLFVANFYGKLSLPRVLSDHGKMRRFYEKMSAQLAQRGQTEELLRALAREELIENGNWCSYQRDNTPDFSL